MHQFESTGYFTIEGYGTGVTVKNTGIAVPEDLVGDTVLIDGERIVVRAVETFGPDKPFAILSVVKQGGKLPRAVTALKGAKMTGTSSSGGKKGDAIRSLIAEHPDWSRKQIAEAVGCTVSRVGEVMRAGGTATLAAAAATTPVVAAVLDREPVIGSAVAFDDGFAPLVRHIRCEHEKAKKAETGSCKICVPYEAPATGLRPAPAARAAVAVVA